MWSFSLSRPLLSSGGLRSHLAERRQQSTHFFLDSAAASPALSPLLCSCEYSRLYPPSLKSRGFHSERLLPSASHSECRVGFHVSRFRFQGSTSTRSISSAARTAAQHLPASSSSCVFTHAFSPSQPPFLRSQGTRFLPDPTLTFALPQLVGSAFCSLRSSSVCRPPSLSSPFSSLCQLSLPFLSRAVARSVVSSSSSIASPSSSFSSSSLSAASSPPRPPSSRSSSWSLWYVSLSANSSATPQELLRLPPSPASSPSLSPSSSAPSSSVQDEQREPVRGEGREEQSNGDSRGSSRSFAALPITSLSVGRTHGACVIDGKVFMFGRSNAKGQLGSALASSALRPSGGSSFSPLVSLLAPLASFFSFASAPAFELMQVDPPEGGWKGKVVKVACGATHACALTDLGCMYTWGAPSGLFQGSPLGVGDCRRRVRPTLVSSVSRISSKVSLHIGPAVNCLSLAAESPRFRLFPTCFSVGLVTPSHPCTAFFSHCVPRSGQRVPCRDLFLILRCFFCFTFCRLSPVRSSERTCRGRRLRTFLDALHHPQQPRVRGRQFGLWSDWPWRDGKFFRLPGSRVFPLGSSPLFSIFRRDFRLLASLLFSRRSYAWGSFTLGGACRRGTGHLCGGLAAFLAVARVSRRLARSHSCRDAGPAAWTASCALPGEAARKALSRRGASDEKQFQLPCLQVLPVRPPKLRRRDAELPRRTPPPPWEAPDAARRLRCTYTRARESRRRHRLFSSAAARNWMQRRWSSSRVWGNRESCGSLCPRRAGRQSGEGAEEDWPGAQSRCCVARERRVSGCRGDQGRTEGWKRRRNRFLSPRRNAQQKTNESATHCMRLSALSPRHRRRSFVGMGEKRRGTAWQRSRGHSNDGRQHQLFSLPCPRPLSAPRRRARLSGGWKFHAVLRTLGGRKSACLGRQLGKKTCGYDSPPSLRAERDKGECHEARRRMGGARRRRLRSGCH
ncbi:regulator of chromosome condensation (RCC1) repeat-containing protein, partial [Toxoplasma gondii FOU]